MNKLEILEAAKQIIDEGIAQLSFNEKKLTPEEKLISLIEGCVIYTEKENPDSVFLMKDGNCVFEIEKSTLWCSYKNIWSVFEREDKMQYTGIQSLIKKVVEERYKLKGLTPSGCYRRGRLLVEERYKLKGLTPSIKQQP
jgi:hypothetical protein